MSENSSDVESTPFLEILKSDMSCWQKSSKVVNKLLHSHTTQVYKKNFYKVWFLHFKAVLLFLVLVDCAVIACEIVFDEKVKTHYDYCGTNSTLCQDEIDSQQTKKWKNIYKSLYYTSLARKWVVKSHIYSFILVLSVFVVEFILKILFSAKKFLKSWVHIFDALIVISSWILMLIMLNKEWIQFEKSKSDKWRLEPQSGCQKWYDRRVLDCIQSNPIDPWNEGSSRRSEWALAWKSYRGNSRFAKYFFPEVIPIFKLWKPRTKSWKRSLLLWNKIKELKLKPKKSFLKIDSLRGNALILLLTRCPKTINC